MGKIAYLVEELKTGLVDGYWMSFDGANGARDYFQSEFPSLQFVVKPAKITHALQDCELINMSSWWRNKNAKN